MLVSEDGFDGLEIEWGTAAVDERLKHLFHVPAHLKDQVATVFDLIVGVLIMEPAALLLVEVEGEAHTGVNPTLADLAQSPYSPLFGQGLCDLRQAGGVRDSSKTVSLLGEGDSRLACLAGDVLMAVQDHLGRKGRMTADLDGEMAPLLDEQQGKEGAEHVAANGHVAAVVDWASGKHGLGLAEQLLDPQSVAIAQHDLKRGELGVGAQHIEPVKARVFGDPRLVDGEMLGRDGLEIAAESAFADARLVALGEVGAMPVEDGTALLGIAPHFGAIATEDVPSVADFDLLGLELGELARNPRHDQRDKGRLIINHGAAHFGTAALAHAEDVFELAFLQRGNALGADHAAVGDDADAADAKTSAQPVDDRQQG